jgi:hypothetical protein
MQIPLVTALIDTYKYERYIEQALDSQRSLLGPPGRLRFLPVDGLGQPSQPPAQSCKPSLFNCLCSPLALVFGYRTREFSQLRDRVIKAFRSFLSAIRRGRMVTGAVISI